MTILNNLLNTKMGPAVDPAALAAAAAGAKREADKKEAAKAAMHAAKGRPAVLNAGEDDTNPTVVDNTKKERASGDHKREGEDQFQQFKEGDWFEALRAVLGFVLHDINNLGVPYKLYDTKTGQLCPKTFTLGDLNDLLHEVGDRNKERLADRKLKKEASDEANKRSNNPVTETVSAEIGDTFAASAKKKASATKPAAAKPTKKQGSSSS